MMFASLRSRLWLTYALLIAVVLTVVGIGLYLALVRNTSIYRQATLTLRMSEAVTLLRLDNAPQATTRQLDTLARQIAANRNVRLLLIDPGGATLIDTGQATGQPALRLPKVLKPNNTNLNQVGTLRDAKLRIWLYTLALDNSNRYLMVAVPRPRLALLTLLTDDLFLPLAEVGAAALLIAFLLAILMARWISAPLQRIRAAASEVAAGQYHPIPLEGPTEVKDLAHSINEMTRRVEVSQQSQRDFIANISHELKTPLTSIQGFAQAIQDGTVSAPEALQQAAGVIISEAGRMYDLVMDLLSLARLDAGTADLRTDPVDLNELLNNVADKFIPQARKAQVTLQTRLDPLPTIQGDSDRLAQVFNNLIDNAIKFTPAGGSVQISAAPLAKGVEVKVADTGIGIAPADQQRIFERFYQADKSRRGGSHRGVGLGLAIARQIIQAHGGSLTVRSQPGQGSEFSVRLPAA